MHSCRRRRRCRKPKRQKKPVKPQQRLLRLSLFAGPTCRQATHDICLLSPSVAEIVRPGFERLRRDPPRLVAASVYDIALDWMVTEAEKLGLLFDPSVLQRNKSAAGMQHDERKSSLFKYAGRRDRQPPHDAPLHDTVLERFEAGKVLHYDEMKLYRPECLRDHDIVGKYYSTK